MQARRSQPDRARPSPGTPAAYQLPQVDLELTRVMRDCGVTDDQAAAQFRIGRTTWLLVRTRRGYYPGYAAATPQKQQEAERLAFRRHVEAWVWSHPKLQQWLCTRGLEASAIWSETTRGTLHRRMPAGFSRNALYAKPDHIEHGAVIPWEVEMLDTRTLKHFKLFRNPFTLEVEKDRDLFFGEEHRYVYDCLWEAAHQAGFVALVGDVGAGKSTLRDKLFRELTKEDQVTTIFPQTIDKTRLTAEYIADAVIFDISGEKPRQRLEDKARQMVRLLRERAAAGRKHLLVLEEAHLLQQRTLRYLKQFWEFTLTTGEGTQRLLGILLIGQLELKAKLAESGDGWGIREMVRRCQLVELGPLNGDSRAYLQHLLTRAGGALDRVITPDAVDALAERLKTRDASGRRTVSLTYPLMLHRWLAKAMREAALRGESKVTAELVRELGAC